MSKNYNAAHYFVDRHLGTHTENKSAFIEAAGAQHQITYGELAQKSSRMASLYEKNGIQREDRAIMLVLDQVEFPIIFWGSLKCGVVPVALNTLLTEDVYTAIFDDSRAKALFVSHELYSTVEPVITNNPYLRAVFVVGGQTDGRLNFNEELANCDSLPTIKTKPDESAFWLYSSGSTGQPKGVRHVHGNLKSTADTYGEKVLNIQPNDVVFSVAKLFFAYGLGNGMTFPMSVGASTVLLNNRPTPDAVVNVLNTHNPTVFCGVPTLYAALNAHLEHGKGKLTTKLRRCISAGEALPADVGMNWEKFSDCEILDGVGSTEMLHIFLSNHSGDVEYGTSGTAVPGYETRLVDEQNNLTKDGELGELLVKGDSAASDYWNKREKSRQTFEGEWTRTGDKYIRRADGRYIYCGRTDDMFKVSGNWVSPFEVEQSLTSHPSVLEAAVVPAVDYDNLEKPKAFVVLNDSTDTANIESILQEHVKSQIELWKYPRWIEVVNDLPKTATGKIQRFKLKDTPK